MHRNDEIAFVIHGLVMGGAEKFLISLINDFDKRGHATFLILLSNDNRLLYELNSNTIVQIITRTSRFDLSISRRIKRAIQSRAIQKVFCINTYSFFLTKLAYLFDHSTQFYLSLHSTIPSSTKSFIQNLLYFRVVQEKDTLLFLCENQRNYLIKRYFLDKARYFTINNGINTGFYNPIVFPDANRDALRTSLNLLPHQIAIVQVARLHPEKGYEDSIAALSILHTHFRKRAHLVVVGGGSKQYVSYLTSTVRHYQLAAYVHFVGEQPDIRNYLSIADVFTLTSTGTETFSLAALEAMSFGVPCSLTNIGGASEMIIEGVNGALSVPNDPYSIASSWNTILDAEMSKSVIRDIVIKRFDAQRMFDSYAAELIQYSC